MYHFLFLFKMYSVLLPYNILCNIWTYCQMKYVIPFFPPYKGNLYNSHVYWILLFFFFSATLTRIFHFFFFFFPPLPVAYKTYFTLHDLSYHMGEKRYISLSITWNSIAFFTLLHEDIDIYFPITWKTHMYLFLVHNINFIRLYLLHEKNCIPSPIVWEKKYMYIFPITREKKWCINISLLHEYIYDFPYYTSKLLYTFTHYKTKPLTHLSPWQKNSLNTPFPITKEYP